MKPSILCLFLLSACSDLTVAHNYRAYALSWTCLSSQGCERADQIESLDRAEIINGSVFLVFLSTKNQYFREDVRMIPSDSLQSECSWIYDFSILATEAEPSIFCHTRTGFELELSIPNRDLTARSEWLVEGREIEP